MKRFILAAVFLGAAGAAQAADKKKDAEALTEAWTAFATPGAEHQRLAAMVGSFKHTIRTWPAAGAEPIVSTGTNQGQWIMGGRYLEQRAQGMTFGQPFEGLGITGYNNARKVYESFWIDNHGTAFMTGTGRFTAAGFEEMGSFTDPVAGPRRFRATTTFPDADHYVYEMRASGSEGKEFKMVEIHYERVK